MPNSIERVCETTLRALISIHVQSHSMYLCSITNKQLMSLADQMYLLLQASAGHLAKDCPQGWWFVAGGHESSLRCRLSVGASPPAMIHLSTHDILTCESSPSDGRWSARGTCECEDWLVLHKTPILMCLPMPCLTFCVLWEWGQAVGQDGSGGRGSFCQTIATCCGSTWNGLALLARLSATGVI